MTTDAVARRAKDVRDARLSYPATRDWTYFNTAAVGLASQAVADAYRAFHSLYGQPDGKDPEVVRDRQDA